MVAGLFIDSRPTTSYFPAMAETISQLELRGFTHLSRHCPAPGCPSVVSFISFERIRELQPRWLLSAMTIEEVQAKMPCKRCGSRKIELEPIDRRDEMARMKAHSYPEFKRER